MECSSCTNEKSQEMERTQLRGIILTSDRRVGGVAVCPTFQQPDSRLIDDG